jgi:hypothetical protein
MQPNGSQNFWQPQDDQRGASPSAPPNPPQPVAQPQQPSPATPQAAPQTTSTSTPTTPPVEVTPHDQVFVAPPQQVHTNTESADEEAEDQPAMTWEASEYINHEKDILWYLSFVIVVLVLLGAALWVQAWTFVVLIIIMAIATIVYINRPPRTMRYSLSGRGLHIGTQFHPYNEYHAFGVVDDGPLLAIMLVSTKRFMPMTLIYFAEQDGDKIVSLLSEHLPMEDLDLDFADIVIRKLRL